MLTDGVATAKTRNEQKHQGRIVQATSPRPVRRRTRIRVRIVGGKGHGVIIRRHLHSLVTVYPSPKPPESFSYLSVIGDIGDGKI